MRAVIHRRHKLKTTKLQSLSRKANSCAQGCYVYGIYVDGVLRYIGKGTNERMYAHMKEVRSRLTRKFKLKNISPAFQRKLTAAVIRGAMIEEVVLRNDLTPKQAYQLEHRHMKQFVCDGKRDQLWNVIPPSIYSAQEYEAYIKRLVDNSRSTNRLARFFARSQLIRLSKGDQARPVDYLRRAGGQNGVAEIVPKMLPVVVPRTI